MIRVVGRGVVPNGSSLLLLRWHRAVPLLRFLKVALTTGPAP